MLAIRIQVIDGVGTFTPPDSQPCRLLLMDSEAAAAKKHAVTFTFQRRLSLAHAGSRVSRALIQGIALARLGGNSRTPARVFAPRTFRYRMIETLLDQEHQLRGDM
jgi:hypothetical protein